MGCGGDSGKALVPGGHSPWVALILIFPLVYSSLLLMAFLVQDCSCSSHSTWSLSVRCFKFSLIEWWLLSLLSSLCAQNAGATPAQETAAQSTAGPLGVEPLDLSASP